jgi:hypothetical protein
MVVRTAELSVRVNDIDKTEQEVSRIVRRYGGYIDSTSSNDLSSEHPDMTIAMRVPVADFDAILSGMEGLGVRMSKTV